MKELITCAQLHVHVSIWPQLLYVSLLWWPALRTLWLYNDYSYYCAVGNNPAQRIIYCVYEYGNKCI